MVTRISVGLFVLGSLPVASMFLILFALLRQPFEGRHISVGLWSTWAKTDFWAAFARHSILGIGNPV